MRLHGPSVKRCIALAGVCFAFVACKARGSRASATQSQPLTAASWRIPLTVPGYAAAELAVPLAARERRPVLVALHGDADRAEWTCGSYRGVIGQRGFILCPSGISRGDGRFRFGSVEHTEHELRAALPRLKQRFPEHVAKGSVVLAALGPSVEHAIAIALQEPSFFSRLLLVDGSLRAFHTGAMARYAEKGGQRVLIVCTPGACDRDVDDHATSLRPLGVDARVIHLSHGHGLDGEVTARLAKEWPWLVTGDARWH